MDSSTGEKRKGKKEENAQIHEPWGGKKRGFLHRIFKGGKRLACHPRREGKRLERKKRSSDLAQPWLRGGKSYFLFFRSKGEKGDHSELSPGRGTGKSRGIHKEEGQGAIVTTESRKEEGEKGKSPSFFCVSGRGGKPRDRQVRDGGGRRKMN